MNSVADFYPEKSRSGGTEQVVLRYIHSVYACTEPEQETRYKDISCRLLTMLHSSYSNNVALLRALHSPWSVKSQLPPILSLPECCLPAVFPRAWARRRPLSSVAAQQLLNVRNRHAWPRSDRGGAATTRGPTDGAVWAGFTGLSRRHLTRLCRRCLAFCRPAQFPAVSHSGINE